jgi:hypothetical protein
MLIRNKVLQTNLCYLYKSDSIHIYPETLVDSRYPPSTVPRYHRLLYDPIDMAKQFEQCYMRLHTTWEGTANLL